MANKWFRVVYDKDPYGGKIMTRDVCAERVRLEHDGGMVSFITLDDSGESVALAVRSGSLISYEEIPSPGHGIERGALPKSAPNCGYTCPYVRPIPVPTVWMSGE